MTDLLGGDGSQEAVATADKNRAVDRSSSKPEMLYFDTNWGFTWTKFFAFASGAWLSTTIVGAVFSLVLG